MTRDMNKKLMQDQIDRLTLKKKEVKFLTKEEVDRLKVKYNEPGDDEVANDRQVG